VHRVRPMWFISGWGFNEQVFAPLAEQLVPAGKKRLLNGNTLLSAGALEDLLDETAEPPVVVAWSMGGIRAIEAAAARPDSVAALVLISTTLKFCSDHEYLWGVPQANLRAMKLGIRKDPETTLNAFGKQVCAPQTEEILPSQVLHTDTCDLGHGLDYLKASDLRERKLNHMPPSLVYHGKKDNIISSNAGRMVSQKLNSANFMRYNGIGHALPLVQTMILAANITFFLEKLHD